MMTFLIAFLCYSLLKCVAIIVGMLSASCEYASWLFDRLDAVLFQAQTKLEAHADRYVVRDAIPPIRPNKGRI